MGEIELLEWLRGQIGDPDHLGDDAARLELGELSVAVTVDSQIAGVHVPFDLAPEIVARRLLAVNLSDLAAVGADPAFAFLALNTPANYPRRRFFGAFLEAAEREDVTLAGGDLASTDRLTATLTLIGTLDSAASWPGRDRARAGDTLWVGGTLGESALGLALLSRGASWDPGSDAAIPPPGLPAAQESAARRALRRHLLPDAQLELGRWIAGRERAATVDLSDGLARDLHRVLRASGIGAELEAERLPAAEGTAALATWLDEDLLDLQLGGGEDYVLLFALPSDAEPPSGCHRIGRVVEGEGLRLLTERGSEELPPRGWDHLAADPGS
ncbi:MAG: thiamine-phosphate kinase [Thermoanaerobaculia bacterium]|nr:thiamine-phosphate kinase [Thermoanaerobaculia bacterium]